VRGPVKRRDACDRGEAQFISSLSSQSRS
jgi:hypothetical protein